MKDATRRSFLASVLAMSALPSSLTAKAKSIQRDSSVEADALECLLDDDTECTMSIWKEEFDSNRNDDRIRNQYFTSLLMHGLRSLDKGHLADAKSAYRNASEILPSSNAIAFQYLGNATSSFDHNLMSLGMEFVTDESPYVDADIERAYLQTPGYIGANTTVIALTAKTPGRFNYWDISTRADPRIAYRFNFMPLSTTGYVVCHLGEQKREHPVFLEIHFLDDARALWSVYVNRGNKVEYIVQVQDVRLELEKWHMFEIRIQSLRLELWIDFAFVSAFTIQDLDYRKVGYGVGLKSISMSFTFTTLFDDEALYSLM